jgi:hypothetical protein
MLSELSPRKAQSVAGSLVLLALLKRMGTEDFSESDRIDVLHEFRRRMTVKRDASCHK